MFGLEGGRGALGRGNARRVAGARETAPPPTPQHTHTHKQKKQRLGANVVRVWAFQDRLPSAPGSYNESQFRGVDYVVAAAARRGLKLVVSLGNFWKAGLGPEKWLGFVGEGGDVASFYRCVCLSVCWGFVCVVCATNKQHKKTTCRSAAVRAAYKQHLVTMVSRVNSLTGVAYKDDSTILGWCVFACA